MHRAAATDAVGEKAEGQAVMPQALVREICSRRPVLVAAWVVLLAAEGCNVGMTAVIEAQRLVDRRNPIR